MTDPDGAGAAGVTGGTSAVGGLGGADSSSGGEGGLGGEGVVVGAGGSTAAASFGSWAVLTAIGSEHFILGQNTTRDLSLSLYDLDGALELRASQSFQLNNNFDVNDSALFSVVVDPSDDGYWLTGHTRRPLTGIEQVAEFDTYVMKLDADGQRIWAMQYSLAEMAAPATIYEMRVQSVDTDGNAYTFLPNVHVATFGKLDPEGGTVWEREVDFDSIFFEHFPDYSGFGVPVEAVLHLTETDKPGTSYLWASLAPLHDGGLSVSYLWMVVKIEDGAVVWSKAFTDPCEGSAVDGDWIAALGVTADESAIYAVGPCLTKLDADGGLVWSTKGPDDYPPILGSVDYQERFSLLTSKAGDAFYVMTPNGSSIDASSKLVRYDSNGDLVWHVDDVGGRVQDLHVLPDSGELLYTLYEPDGIFATQKVARRRAADGTELSRLP